MAIGMCSRRRVTSCTNAKMNSGEFFISLLCDVNRNRILTEIIVNDCDFLDVL